MARSIFNGAHAHVGGGGSDDIHLDEGAMMQLFCRDHCTRKTVRIVLAGGEHALRLTILLHSKILVPGERG